MKVTHKLVVTEPAEEVQEKLRKALAASGVREVTMEGITLQGEALSGPSLVVVEVDCETTVHGTQLTFRAKDQGAWNQPARKVLRQVQNHFWNRPVRRPRMNWHRKRRHLLREWMQPIIIAVVVLAFAAAYFLWIR